MNNPSRILYVLMIGLILVFGGYSGVRYLIDRNLYAAGQQAYEQADCAAAIDYNDRIIMGWRLLDFGEVQARAQQKKGECQRFQVAVEKQQAQDFSAALVGYLAFLESDKDSTLVNTARARIARFIEAGPTALADQEFCAQLDTLLERDLFPQPAVYLPAFYLACGQVYESAENWSRSLTLYKALLTEYPDHLLAPAAESALLGNPLSCEDVDSLKQDVHLLARADFVPRLYFECGRMFDDQDASLKSYDLYRSFLTEYPDHALAAEVEAALLANPISCDRYEDLQITAISGRPAFMPALYYQCGQTYQAEDEWQAAIRMYELFLADYAGHPLAAEVERGLALAIVAQAKQTSAGEIPAPERSGSVAGEATEVIIQNESPERLRIVFSGPETRVEELGACSLCTTYLEAGPSECPDLGPLGRYELAPGQYDVVVEAIGDRGTTPWTGNWQLQSGDEYYNCFFIVTTFRP